MKELLATVAAWRDEGVGLGRAVLTRAYGSSPRQPGAALIVGDDGRMAGSVSGGCVEGAALQEIQRARKDGRSRLVTYGISDETAWDVGLACGGTIEVLIEPELRVEVLEAAQAAVDGRSGVVAIPLPAADAPETPAPVVVLDEGSTAEPLGVAAAAAIGDGESRVVEVDRRAWFLEAFIPPPRLVVFGAVHIAAPLIAFANELGYRTVVVDRRRTFASGQRLPESTRVMIEWPDRAAEVLELGPRDAVAVLSHDPKLDEPAIVAALQRGCHYVGAIGSRKTQADRRARLLATGLTDEQLARLHGPIGLDLGGREVAEIALAIMSEIVAARRGGSSLPLAAAQPA